MTFTKIGGNQNEVVRFGEMVEARGLRNAYESSEIGNKASLEAMLQAANIEQEQMPNGEGFIVASDVDVIELIGKLTVENARLQEANYTDSRTGLPNYKFFDQKLIEYIGLGRRSHEANETPQRETFSLVFFDFNNFKKYNDEHGHPAADQKMKDIADIFQKYARRSTDHICRYGGDEYALILWEVNRRDADAVACGMREEVLKKTGISLSYGVANYASDVDDADYSRPVSEVACDLVTVADKRMQHEKAKYKALDTSILRTEEIDDIDYKVAA